MLGLSSTDFAIALAVKNGTLRLMTRNSRLGGTFIAIEDDCGVIEVVDNAREAETRLKTALGL